MLSYINSLWLQALIYCALGFFFIVRGRKALPRVKHEYLTQKENNLYIASIWVISFIRLVQVLIALYITYKIMWMPKPYAFLGYIMLFMFWIYKPAPAVVIDPHADKTNWCIKICGSKEHFDRIQRMQQLYKHIPDDWNEKYYHKGSGFNRKKSY